MQRNTINFVIALLSFLNLLAIVFTGFVTKYVLPPGTGGLRTCAPRRPGSWNKHKRIMVNDSTRMGQHSFLSGNDICCSRDYASGAPLESDQLLCEKIG